MRLGTVFSGIGAIEHALERMGIDYEVAFACDNSNIDWTEKLTKKGKMIQFLQQLDEVGARAEGLSKLASCWEDGCECTESLDVKQIRDDLKAKEVVRFENLSLICESCLAKNEQNEVEEPKYRFFSQVVICVFERSGYHFHDGFECRMNPADAVPLTSIRAVELRKIPKSKHKSASEAN